MTSRDVAKNCQRIHAPPSEASLRRLASDAPPSALGVAATALLVAHAARRRPGRTPRRSTAPIDVIEVSGLLDPVRGRRHRAGHRPGRARRRAGARHPDEHRQAPSCRDDRMAELAERDPRRRRCRSRSGSGRAVRGPTGLPASSSAPRPSPAWRPAAASATSATPLDVPAALTRLRRQARPLDEHPGATDARRRRGASKPASIDTGTPTLGTSSSVLDGVDVDGTTLDTAEVVQKGTSCAAQPPIAPGPLRQARPAAPADAHRGQPAGRLPAAHHRAVPARLRVLHRRRRHRRRRRRASASCSAATALVALPDPARGRSRCSCSRCWPSPSTCRPACRGSGRAWASSRSSSAPCSSTTACRCRGSRCWPAIGGVLLAFLAGMPSMVRTRFATPTIGREWMIGEMGEAVVAVDPDGVVVVRDAQWRARTNRATPDRGRRADPGGRHRRRHARGRARGRRGPRTTASTRRRAAIVGRSVRRRGRTCSGTAPCGGRRDR